MLTWFLQIHEASNCNCSLISDDGEWMQPELDYFLKCVKNICDYLKTTDKDCIYARKMFFSPLGSLQELKTKVRDTYRNMPFYL